MDYTAFEIFAPVVKGASARIILALRGSEELAIVDVSNAFLNGELDEVVYLRPPKGFPTKDPNHVWILYRPLYGLHISARKWNTRLRDFLIKMGFKPLKNDPCVFIREREGSQPDVIFVHVDDNVIVADSKQVIKEVMSKFREEFKINENDEPENIVGLQIHKRVNGFEDNQSCIAIVMNPISHARSKHFAVRSAFIRDLIENKTVEIVWCPTKLMIADLLTKALDPTQHEYLTELIGLKRLSSLQ